MRYPNMMRGLLTSELRSVEYSTTDTFTFSLRDI
jgi:hypothetical protein